MKLLKNKKGMGLPMVLGITVFVIGLSATLMSYIIFQSKMVELDISQTEDYQNSVSDVSAALNIIAREQNLDPTFLAELESYFDKTINNYNDQVFMISSTVNANDQVISYLTGSVQEVSTFETIFSQTGTENDFILSPLVTPTNMLSTYLADYIDNTFSWIEPETGFTSFDEIMNYVEDLSMQGVFQYKTPNDLENQWQPTAWWHWYVDGDVEIETGIKRENNEVRNLTVKDGQILFINGDLTMNAGSTIDGNVVLNGNLKIIGKGNSEQGIEGTIYVNGNVEIDKNLRLGTQEDPSFIFAEGNIMLSNQVSGYGYFLSDSFEGNQGNIDITGGVYVSDGALLPPGGISENTSFTNENLYDYVIPEVITVDPDDLTDPGEITTTFKFTFPKLN